MKSGTLLLQVASRTKPHEVKSTDMHCILATNINICRGENTTRRKKCQIFASAMYPSYQAGVSPEGGLEVGRRTLCFFLEALSEQTNLFCREMKIKKIYLKSNTRQENFRTFEERDIFCPVLYGYYSRALAINYDPDSPRSFKSICLKCNTARFLDQEISCCM